jgi:hypothetical protein
VASSWYPKYKEAILTGAANSNASSGNVKAVLVDLADYTYSATHEFLSDVGAPARVATSGNFANKTFTNGLFDADDITFTGVTGDQSEAIVIYIDTGTAATSRLMLFIDTASSGLPVTPNSGAINIVWDNGSNKIAQL